MASRRTRCVADMVTSVVTLASRRRRRHIVVVINMVGAGLFCLADLVPRKLWEDTKRAFLNAINYICYYLFRKKMAHRNQKGSVSYHPYVGTVRSVRVVRTLGATLGSVGMLFGCIPTFLHAEN